MPTHYTWSDSTINPVNCWSLGLSIDAICSLKPCWPGPIKGSVPCLIYWTWNNHQYGLYLKNATSTYQRRGLNLGPPGDNLLLYHLSYTVLSLGDYNIVSNVTDYLVCQICRPDFTIFRERFSLKLILLSYSGKKISVGVVHWLPNSFFVPGYSGSNLDRAEKFSLSLKSDNLMS